VLWLVCGLSSLLSSMLMSLFVRGLGVEEAAGVLRLLVSRALFAFEVYAEEVEGDSEVSQLHVLVEVILDQWARVAHSAIGMVVVDGACSCSMDRRIW
jgi:hypothetical protein